MEIYLVRHAAAVEPSEGLEDQVRWLTEKGRKAMKKVAVRLRKKRVRPALIVTSPLTRAVQTAELLMAELGSHATLVADSRLASGSSVEQAVELIQSLQQFDAVMLVGHEPLLGQLAAQLLRAEAQFSLAKGSCLLLQLRHKAGKPARFGWYAAAGTTIRSAKKFLAPRDQPT